MQSSSIRFAALLAVVVPMQLLAQTPIPPPPEDFAVMAVQSDQYEIMAGYDASHQAVDPRVRAFAQRMIADHTQMQNQTQQAAQASGLHRPRAAMSADQAMLLTSLQSLRGPDFDRMYLRQQVLAHTQALTVGQSFATDGADPLLRRSAQSALPTIQRHLAAAQQLRSSIGAD